MTYRIKFHSAADAEFSEAARWYEIREAIVSRFPYCVYYRVKRKRILITAVFHTSRDPAVWQSRN